MLDIRTLLLGHPEDRYEPNVGLRAAEVAVFPLLFQARTAQPSPPQELPDAMPVEVTA
jgi:hypothetical protein